MEYLSFRPLNQQAEILESLRLRFDVYEKSNIKSLLTHNEFDLDFDAYDLCALHFGLFEEGPHQSKLIGSMRVILGDKGPQYDFLHQISKEFNLWSDHFDDLNKYPLPYMKYGTQGEQLRHAYWLYRSQGKRIIEGSRFTLRESHRNFRNAMYMLEASSALTFYHYGFSHAVIVCCPDLQTLYRRFGFEPLQGTRQFEHQGNKGMYLIKPYSPPNERMSAMSSAFQDHGQICFHPKQAHQYHPPLKEAG